MNASGSPTVQHCGDWGSQIPKGFTGEIVVKNFDDSKVRLLIGKTFGVQQIIAILHNDEDEK
jgi:hypothetical protein